MCPRGVATGFGRTQAGSPGEGAEEASDNRRCPRARASATVPYLN